MPLCLPKLTILAETSDCGPTKKGGKFTNVSYLDEHVQTTSSLSPCIFMIGRRAVRSQSMISSSVDMEAANRPSRDTETHEIGDYAEAAMSVIGIQEINRNPNLRGFHGYRGRRQLAVFIRTLTGLA